MRLGILGFLICAASLLPTVGGAKASPAQLFQFDSPDLLKKWTVNYNPLKTEAVALSREFALDGGYSLLLKAPQWQPGQPEWPIWLARGNFAENWRPYDRIAIDFVNPTNATSVAIVKVADDESAKRGIGYWPGIKVPVRPYSHERAVLPLATFLKGIYGHAMNPSKMAAFLFGATRPFSDYKLYVSDIRLLKPGENPPPLPPTYANELLDLKLRPMLAEGRETMRAVSDALQSVPDESTRAWALDRLAKAETELAALEKKTQAPDFELDDVERTTQSVEKLQRLARRLPSLARLRIEAEKRGYAAGWVSSMQKVIPREMPLPSLRSDAPWELSAARNETESAQIVVIPFGKELKDVRLEAGEFRSASGAVLPKDAISIRTVGYVQTKQPHFEVDYSGWWPDPLLDFLPSISIAPEDAQAFWVSARIPAEQEAGVYEGEIRIIADDAPPTVEKLAVRVRRFALAGTPPIPVAIPAGKADYFKQFSNEPWDTFKYRVADFQADYGISWNNLYDPVAPDWDVLEHLKKQGRLGLFNLYPVYTRKDLLPITRAAEGATPPEAAEASIRTLIKKIRPIYEEAKERGLLEHAYLYGMDEAAPDQFPGVKKLTDEIKNTFPEVPILTTAKDFELGESSHADGVDGWIPILQEFNADKARRARERGKSVWWYNCYTPAHPYPNQFIEYPAIELRLLHGAMAAKEQPDGYLYYSPLFRGWQPPGSPPRHAIEGGPFTDWNPSAVGESESVFYNGEGYLAYPGPGGRPLASLRLENFRDGLDDLAWWKLLRKEADALRTRGDLSDSQRQWLIQTDAALEVPDDLVKSTHEFTLDPTRVTAWRERIGDLLDSLPESSFNQPQPN